jgi:hypothetical protein
MQRYAAGASCDGYRLLAAHGIGVIRRLSDGRTGVWCLVCSAGTRHGWAPTTAHWWWHPNGRWSSCSTGVSELLQTLQVLRLLLDLLPCLVYISMLWLLRVLAVWQLAVSRGPHWQVPRRLLAAPQAQQLLLVRGARASDILTVPADTICGCCCRVCLQCTGPGHPWTSWLVGFWSGHNRVGGACAHTLASLRS